jgi:transcription-repair coupling factor (superfamily II helicase)
VCTTIVESGVDIPSANTLVIDDSDRYGLAQLYQIRGRVGRSEVQAYAYLYYEPEKILTEDTKNRLRAIREFTALGSGYQIAMRDLEIRGVGNVLGAEQHGHMIQVGFEMYCELLDQAIDAAQQGKELSDDGPEPSVIDINVTALIPDKYVGHVDVKLNEYKRLANTSSEKALDVIEAEWQDRFGPVPDKTQTLLQLTRLRIQATDLTIPMVRSDDEYLRISVPYTLQQWMKLQQQMPPALGQKLRWVAGVRTNENSSATLLYRLNGMDGLKQLKLVTELFGALKPLITQLKAQLEVEAANNAKQALLPAATRSPSISEQRRAMMK